jgi:hypothetical protein
MYSSAPFKKKDMSSIQSGYNGGKQASTFAWNAWIGSTLCYEDNREHVISKRNSSNFPLCAKLNIFIHITPRSVHFPTQWAVFEGSL